VLDSFSLMTITVVPIFKKESDSDEHLHQVMHDRVQRLADELKQVHLKSLQTAEPLYDDVVIYISYNNKYGVLWKVVNDVPLEVTDYLKQQCLKLGYLEWNQGVGDLKL